MTRILFFIGKLLGIGIGSQGGAPGAVISVLLLVWAILDILFWIAG